MGIYRAGTLSRAAQHLGFTQPALSQHLKALEAQLGKPLFKRLPRGLAPTPAAHALAQTLGPHLDAMVATVEAARVGTEKLAGPLSLGGPAELLGAKVFPTLCLCTLWQSGIQLRVQTGDSEEQLLALKSGALDLLITAESGPIPGLKMESLYEESLVLVGAPRWAERLKAQSPDPGTFEGVPLLACPGEFSRYFLKAFGAEPAQLPSLVVDDLRAAMAAAIGGMGAAVLPRYLCEASLRSGELVQLHAPRELPRRTFHLARRKGPRPNPRLAVLWDLILKSAEAW